MIRITLILAAVLALTSAAQAWPRYGYWSITPWGPQCAICSYGPARIPPGFQAPPVFDPYDFARQAQGRYLPPRYSPLPGERAP